MINEKIILWVGFTLFIIGMLALDLSVFQRKPHIIKMKEALAWFGFWIILALIFNLGVIFFHERGMEAGLEFFTGFIVEKSLSIDNIFVFILIFNYFRVPEVYQHKVLFWGIVGAVVMRAIFILAGLSILNRFSWSIYLFGGLLLITGIVMMTKKKQNFDPKKNWLIQLFCSMFPVTPHYHGNNFFTRKGGRLMATPLFIVLLAIESSDIIFAIDSIPAIFAITSDPFIVYTSNIFAMLGLRSLYFAIAGFMNSFYFLHYGFASIIIILAIKMLISDFYHIPVALSLQIIIFILLVCVIISLLWPRKADLKMLFERLENLKLITFRRLLMFENIIDLGEIKVRDSMQPSNEVATIQMDMPWEENKKLIEETRFSRYPLIEQAGKNPIGIIHVKNLVFLEDNEVSIERLRSLARKTLVIKEDLLLEEALARFQRSYENMAIVVNSHNVWTGILGIEDVLEEIVGRIGDEFDLNRTGKYISLADALTPGRIVFNLEANSMFEAIQTIIKKIPTKELPVNRKTIINAVQKRDARISTYLGGGLAVPRGRIKGIDKPMLAFARSAEGIPIEGTHQRAELIFLLITPYGIARMQPHLLSDLLDLKDSDYVMDRLRKTNSPEEVIEVIRAGQQVILD